MYILGINAYHGDSSAALIKDGKILAAAEEERFRRIKHWAGFPSESIKYCLNEEGISLSQVDHVAINQDPKANLFKKILFSIMNRPDLTLITDRIKNKRERSDIKAILNKKIDINFKGAVHNIEHHLTHLSSAYHVSNFDEAISVSIDGMGDFASAAWSTCKGDEINIIDKVFFPHSLGIFYQAMTQWLGFPHYGDEYKVMGLAPYGQPKYMKEMREIVKLSEDGSFKLNLKYFKHHKEKIAYEWEDGQPNFLQLYNESLNGLLGPSRKKDEELTQMHKDIARSVQAMYEEAFFNLLNKLHEKYQIDNLCLAGGCAMNSVANGKVYRNTPYKKVYIQSAAGDAGGAIGAAFVTWHKLGGKDTSYMDHAYLGPHFSNSYIGELLKTNATSLQEEHCQVTYEENLDKICDETSDAIIDGKVIGWFQGRMEWGPRALGNRSILGDPRRSDMKDILNLKIKRRESFRPFAPSILRDHVDSWFEEDEDVPFMMQVFQIKKEKRKLIPAVTHADGSGRLQTVTEETNLAYYSLISKFYSKTNVPMLLNTSFNENEPVVCKPDEALSCFLRTKMDFLVLGNYIIKRKG